MLLSLNNDFFRALTAQLFRRYSSRGSSSEDMKFSATCIRDYLTKFYQKNHLENEKKELIGKLIS
ncbi:hypothetical protein LguiA_021402 [Lonicera macranthoides]